MQFEDEYSLNVLMPIMRRGGPQFVRGVTRMGRKQWYVIVSFGSLPVPARGPWPSKDAADAAVDRFRTRHGACAGQMLAISTVGIMGPFATRQAARDSDLNTKVHTRRV